MKLNNQHRSITFAVKATKTLTAETQFKILLTATTTKHQSMLEEKIFI